MEKDIKHIIFYGTLCEGKVRKALRIQNYLEFVSICSLNGSLYDLGDYPGLILNTQQTIQAELYKITNTKCIQILDEYEEFNPKDLKNSLYLRKTIQLPEMNCTAWVYEYNHQIAKEQLIKSGVWIKR